MFKPPAHKSNSAGQIKLSDDQQLYLDSGGLLGTADPPTWRPPRYLRDVIKAAQERSSEEPEALAAPLPLPAAEKRLQVLERALRNLIKDVELRNGPAGNWYSNELKRILQDTIKSS